MTPCFPGAPRFPIIPLPAQAFPGLLSAAKATAMTPKALNDLALSARDELRDNLLPYWTSRSPSPDHTGFVGLVDHKEIADPEASRGMLLTARILWTYAAAHRRWPDGGYLAMADRAYRDLMTNFRDTENGGFVWFIAADGGPNEPFKQTYGEAFAIYGLSEYHRASGNTEALDQAIEVYRLLEKHGRDHEHGGFFELFSADWQRLDASKAAVMDVGPGSKTQNTHLHVMEAFTNLLRVWPDPELKREQQDLVDLMLNRVLDRKTWHLGLVFDDAWNLQSTGISYGHDIEAAWLLCEAAEVVGDADQISSAHEAAAGIARATLAEGVDEDGALFYDGDKEGPINRNKEWWPQVEGVIGFLQAWAVSDDPVFLETAVAMWRFIETHHVDRVNGGWHKSIAPDGTVRADNKIDRWTCPYHNGRACMEVFDRLGS